MQPKGKQQQLLIIGKVWPEPDSSAAGSRMMQLIDLLQQVGWSVHFASAAGESQHRVDLSARDVNEIEIKVNDSHFDEVIRDLQPEVVLFDRFMTEEQFGWRVAAECPDALRILDTEDLHTLRHARHKALQNNRDFGYRDLNNEIAKREIASIYRSDLSLIISKKEMELLKEHFKVPVQLLHYLPFLLDPIGEKVIDNTPKYTERQHFTTIGNYLHEPNWDALRFLKTDIWPIISEKLPEAEMHVYGAYATQKVEQLHNEEERFLIKGRAEDAGEVISRARVLLAPLRFGAGLKGKLIDAMLNGTPSVTTPTGAEAMHDHLPWAGIISKQADEFAEAAVQLYTEPGQWETARQHGRTIINRCFDNNRFGPEFIDRMQSIRNSLDTHRQQNFTGAMLMHHTMASTEYMSRWIEEKNR